ncbi:hypothetical protein RSAG8_13333, partial [Rhizoctonia solani AG-8 WAC10335]
MSKPNLTAETVVDPLETTLPSSTLAEHERADLSMSDRSHSSKTMADYDPLFEIYPMLAPSPTHWRQDLIDLSESVTGTYLNGPDEERTRFVFTPIWVTLELTALSVQYVINYRALPIPLPRHCLATISERAKNAMLEMDAKEEIAFLADIMCRRFGPFNDRRSTMAYPTVYSTPEEKGRPRLPPPHPNPSQRKLTLRRFLAIQHAWQGLSQFNLEASIGKAVSTPVATSRGPANLPWHEPIEDWIDGEVTRLYSHIYAIQNRMDAGDASAMDESFQFVEVDESEPMRTEPAVAMDSLYSHEAAAYYLAGYAALSLSGGRIYADVRRVTPVVYRLIPCVEMNERLDPPARWPQDSDPALLKMMPSAYKELDPFLRIFKVPEAVYMWTHPDHNTYSLRSVWQFVHEQRLIIDGRVAGGTTGVYRVLVCALVISKLFHDIREGYLHLSGNARGVGWDSHEGEILSQILHELINQINGSRKPGIQSNIFAGTEQDRWQPDYVNFTWEGFEPVKLEWPYGKWGNDDTWVYDPSSPMNQGSRQAPPDSTRRLLSGDNRDRSESVLILSPPSQVGTESSAPKPSSNLPTPQTLAVDAAQPAPLSSTVQIGRGTDDSDDDDLYKAFRSRAKKENPPQNPPPTSAAANTAAWHSLSRPSTEKTRTVPLPNSDTRRSHSADPGSQRVVKTAAGSNNALGLQVGQPMGWLGPGVRQALQSELTFDNLQGSSTPQPKIRLDSSQVGASTATEGRVKLGQTLQKSQDAPPQTIAKAAERLFHPKPKLPPIATSSVSRTFASPAGFSPAGDSAKALPGASQHTLEPSPRYATASASPASGSTNLPAGDDNVSGSMLEFAASRFGKGGGDSPQSATSPLDPRQRLCSSTSSPYKECIK